MPIIEGLTSSQQTNYSRISNNMSYEQQLVNDLNLFNQQYQRYIECNNPNLNSNCIVGSEPTPQSLNIIASRIDKNIDNIKTNNFRNSISPSKYQTTNNQINDNYQNVIQLRKEIDIKVKQLYDSDKYKITDYEYEYNSTLISGILITTLATSILYYVFTKL
jgi:hypothetical protein